MNLYLDFNGFKKNFKIWDKKVFDRTILTLIVSFIFSSLLAIVIENVDNSAFRTDFTTFITGARVIREEGGGYLYHLDIQLTNQHEVTKPNELKGLLPFRNHPLVAFLFIPLSKLPFPLASKIYSLVLIVFLLLIIMLSKNVLVNTRNSSWILLPFIFPYSFFAIFTGQITIFLLLLFMLSYIYLSKKLFFWSGFLQGYFLLNPLLLSVLPFCTYFLRKKTGFLSVFLYPLYCFYYLAY